MHNGKTKMKDSGIEWIGEIPEDWEVIKLKYVCDIDKNRLSETTDDHYKFNYIDISSVTEIGGIGETIEMTFGESPSRARMIVSNGDIIISTVRTYLKAIAFIEQSNKYICSTGFSVLTPRKRLLPRFAFYQSQSEYIVQEIVSRSVGVSYPATTSTTLSNIKFIIPPIYIQQIIANYLDKKCTEIDKVIEAKQKQNELLKELRQSIIYEAVTKGLDKNVKYKDSGIEWIGEIPEDWEVIKLRFLGSLDSSGVDKKIREGEPLYKSIHYSDVYNNSLSEIGDSDDYLIISASDNKFNCRLLKGDVLFTNSSETPEDIGNSTVIKENLDDTLFGYHLTRFRPYRPIALNYEKYLFGNQYVKSWLGYRSNGITRYGINYTDFADAQIIIPPISTQHTIADYLDNRCREIDHIINSNNDMIDKLKEYRQSIIYEAVTGKRFMIADA